MKNKEMSPQAKKNLLDLEYNKYLQHYNTFMIILFTYGIGVVISFMTKQIDYTNVNQLILLSLFSVPFVSAVMFRIANFRNKQAEIVNEIRKLEI